MQSDDHSQLRAAFEGLFCREGDFWTIVFEGQLVRLKDAKGLHYLRHLLRYPGQCFHVIELGGVGGLQQRDVGAGPHTERTRKAVTNRIRQTVARIAAMHQPLGAHLANTVYTGTTCAYDPPNTVRWTFDTPLVALIPRS